MKIQVRRSVFETNSSSQHSFCVMKKDAKYTTKEILDGICLFDDRETGEKDCVWNIWDFQLEFGRTPFRAIGTFDDKWLYACATLVKEYNDATYKELVTIAKKYIPGLKKIELPKEEAQITDRNHPNNIDSEYAQKYGKTEDELKEYLKQKEKDWDIVKPIEYWEDEDGYFYFEQPYTGYNETDMLSGFLENEKISLEEFLINKKYVVIQDGDEYCYWNDMKKTGLVDIGAIQYEYPKE